MWQWCPVKPLVHLHFDASSSWHWPGKHLVLSALHEQASWFKRILWSTKWFLSLIILVQTVWNVFSPCNVFVFNLRTCILKRKGKTRSYSDRVVGLDLWYMLCNTVWVQPLHDSTHICYHEPLCTVLRGNLILQCMLYK